MRFPAHRRTAWADALLGVATVALLVGGAACNECTPNEQRCENGNMMWCVKHNDEFRWAWDSIACGAPDLCKISAAGDAFCVLYPDQNPACAGPQYFQCDGTSLVGCVESYVTDKSLCKVCSVPDGGAPATAQPGCTGKLYSSCMQDSDCAATLSCHVTSRGSSTCSRACSCPNGAECRDCAPVTDTASTWSGFENEIALAKCWNGYCESP